MSREIHKTDEAWRDLWQVADYIAEQSGAQHAAEAFLDRIEDCLLTIATQPFIGPSRDDLQTGLRYQPFENYLIFYRPLSNGIEVVRVLHAARDVEALFH